MPYSITYEPLNRIRGVTAKTVLEDSATTAWALVQQLEASDERVHIKDPSGVMIGREELRILAQEEQS